MINFWAPFSALDSKGNTFKSISFKSSKYPSMATMINRSIYLLLLITTSSASPLSFNLSAFSTDPTNREIIIQADANISQEGLLISNYFYRTGRATYAEPLHLWDKATGNLTDFGTHFSFVIQSVNSTCTAEGLAFFLVPVNSTIPTDSFGSGLGLAFNEGSANVAVDPFVAVEFDTYLNPGWDPSTSPHVGINVRSLRSAASAPWRSNLTEGNITDAWISYNSSNKKFLVDFTEFVNQTIQLSSIEYTIDLRDHLPELVNIGFSAASAGCYEKNNVKSWSFNSTLDLKVEPPEPAGKPVGLIAGLSTAAPAAVGLIFLGYRLWRRKRGGRNEEDEDVESMEMDFQKGSGPRRFSYGELAAATDNFAVDRKLGEGGFGGVYRGFLKNLDTHVAVKRVSKTSKQGMKEYVSEVKIISLLRHRYK